MAPHRAVYARDETPRDGMCIRTIRARRNGGIPGVAHVTLKLPTQEQIEDLTAWIKKWFEARDIWLHIQKGDRDGQRDE